MEKDFRLAVMIDAENISSKYTKVILDEISNYGTPTYKRIYGDWTTPQLSSWKSTLLENSIIPVQQYRYTTGKNSTDSALIIDAMDILYSNNVDGFCIVSSDSDFTRLAARLRESGKLVFGFGEKKTPSAFIASCNKFVYIEVLLSAQAEPQAVSQEPHDNGAVPPPAPSTLLGNKDVIITSMLSILKDVGDEEGWAYLSIVGNILSKRHPEFDARNYGFRNLTDFAKKAGHFEVKSRQLEGSKMKHVIIRIKQPKP
jgi:uncharacterized LabA/DUF88 family protein